ncbi:MAG: ABC transporter substrate-binding protein, partial [Deltaproteobacteria bacterium]|nr:ABC transporter substrate-binding protein [Deltaproteobacteria bacterium]
RRLWSNYREIEADYYRRTGIFPIRHTVVVKDEILKSHPWVAASLLQAFEQAKKLGFEHMSDQRRSFLAWYGAQMEEEQAFFGADFWSYSVKKKRATLETMLVYAEEQAITTRRLAVEELFVPSTLDY